MTDFRIEVIIDPAKARAGARAVRGELDRTEDTASKLGGTLKRAFQLVGVGLIVRELGQIADAYTNAQNRLRTVVAGEIELARVTQDLFDISNRTRSSFEGTAEVYARVALATKNLGISQAESLQFTESLNQAIILSGASAQEAQAGLIQLSQGLSSGALRGDELRAVLEQLPAVADVIAKSLGVTRGELRKLGEDGKITAEVVLGAFQEARKELDEKFAKTVPTLGQAFQVLKNNVTEFVGETDKGIGISAGFASVILLGAENLELMAAAILVVSAGILASFVPATLTATVTLAALQAQVLRLGAVLLANPFGIAVAALVAAGVAASAFGNEMIKLEQAIGKAEAAGNKFALTDFGKVGADILRVRDNLERVEAAMAASGQATETQTKLAERYRQQLAALGVQQELLRSGTARTTVQAQEQQKALDALAKSVTDVVAEIEVENGLLQLNSREREIQIALLKEVANLNKGEGPDVTDAQRAEIEVALRRNQVLREQAAVLEQIRGPQEKFQADLVALQTLMDQGTISSEEFSKGLAKIATSTDNLDLSAIGVSGGDSAGVLANIQAMIAATKEQVRQESLRAEILQEINGPLQEMTDRQAVLTALVASGTIKQEQANQSLETAKEKVRLLNPEYAAQRDLLKELEGPQVDLKIRLQSLTALYAQGEIGLAKYALETAKTREEIRLLNPEYAAMKELLAEVLGPAEALEDKQRRLTEAWLVGAISTRDWNAALRETSAATAALTPQEQLQADILESINAPQKQLIATQAALNALLNQGKISAESYTLAMNNAAIAANVLGSSALTGLAAGLAQIENQLLDVGGTVQETIVRGFNAGQDALVDFVRTGTADFQQFVDVIRDGLAKLLVQQALLALFPGGGGIGATIAAAFGGGRAGGGDVRPGQAYVVGEEGPELFTPANPGNIVPAGETAAMLSSNMAPTINLTAPPAQVNIINVRDPSEIPRGIQSAAGKQAVLNVLHGERKTIRGAIG